MKTIRIGSGAGYAGDRAEPAADLIERGNLDSGRLSWLFGREVLPYDDPFDPESYGAQLIIDERAARAAFPDAFKGVLWA